MRLPADCHLAYVIAHEAWYGKAPNAAIPAPHVSVSASKGDVTCVWEFVVEERDHGHTGHPIRLSVFDEAFAAFEQIPEFFTALGERRPGTLAEVVDILKSLGAMDETEYVQPTGR